MGRAFPIARVGLSPLPHPLDVGRAPEDIPVLGLTEPAPLTVGLTGFAALRFGTKLLVMNVPAVGLEQLFAMEAFTLRGLGHRQSE